MICPNTFFHSYKKGPPVVETSISISAICEESSKNKDVSRLNGIKNKESENNTFPHESKTFTQKVLSGIFTINESVSPVLHKEGYLH